MSAKHNSRAGLRNKILQRYGFILSFDYYFSSSENSGCWGWSSNWACLFPHECTAWLEMTFAVIWCHERFHAFLLSKVNCANQSVWWRTLKSKLQMLMESLSSFCLSFHFCKTNRVPHRSIPYLHYWSQDHTILSLNTDELCRYLNIYCSKK